MTQLDLFASFSKDAPVTDPGMACAESVQALDMGTEQTEEEEEEDDSQ
jgi:hypothetical protein